MKYTRDNSSLCSNFACNEAYRALLVHSPAPQVTFAMNFRQLEDIYGLVEGALFQLSLDSYLDDIIG